MRRMKKFAALGLSAAMMASMAVGVHAADNAAMDQQVNGRAEGNTAASASANVDVDGYLTDKAIIDTNGSEVVPSYPDLSTSSSSVLVPTVTSSGNTQISTLLPTYTDGNTPVDSSGSHVSWGDESTANSTQVIITAPTKLSFQVAGVGEDANIQLTTENKNIAGTILNQSAYIDEDLRVVPKDVKVTGKQEAKGEAAFDLVAENGTLPDKETTPDAKTAVKGVYLSLGENRVDFATMNTEQELGTLPKGTPAATATDPKKEAVNASSTKIYFSDKNGKAEGVSTFFGNEYENDTNVKTNYNVAMVYSVN